MTIRLGTDDLAADAEQLYTMLGAMLGYEDGGGDGGNGGDGNTDYFPADPALAPFPSPEDSLQQILDGVVAGRPYLKDINARTHTLRISEAGASEYFINGLSQMDGWENHADSPPTQLLVRQGGVYIFLASGATQIQTGNGYYNTAPPPAWTDDGGDTGGGGGGGGLPPLPGFPVPSPTPPGSSGRIITAGSGQAIATLSDAIRAAQPGDTIQMVPGTYTDAPPAILVPVLLDLGGATLDMTGNLASLAYGKGCIVPCADLIIQNGTIVGTAMEQNEGELTCAIRPNDGCGYVTIRNMRLFDNQCGIGHGGHPCVIDVADSDISDNGLANNQGASTHNLYVGDACRRLTLTNVTSVGCKDAHAIKYRGPELIVNGGTFAASNGSCFDIPNGSTVPFSINNAVMNKGTGDVDHHVMGYGEEYQNMGLAGGTINGGSIAALCNSPFITGAGGTITAIGVALSGNKIMPDGPVVLVGF
jgi:hypothetical protein